MSWEMAQAAQKIWEIQSAIKGTSEDGLLYEDEIVTVKRINGVIEMTSKPIRPPFIYANEVKS